jgi:hypothetical protein
MAIHRITPHRFCPEILILGTHVISPTSALQATRSRSFSFPLYGTCRAILVDTSSQSPYIRIHALSVWYL